MPEHAGAHWAPDGKHGFEMPTNIQAEVGSHRREIVGRAGGHDVAAAGRRHQDAGVGQVEGAGRPVLRSVGKAHVFKRPDRGLAPFGLTGNADIADHSLPLEVVNLRHKLRANSTGSNDSQDGRRTDV